jgi:outer membrane protein assembly factor BamB
MRGLGHSNRCILLMIFICIVPAMQSCAHLAPPTQPIPLISFDTDDANGKIVAHDAAGAVVWERKLSGYLGSSTSRTLVNDTSRVYLFQVDGITALDVHNGNVLWHSNGPWNDMLLSGDLLLAEETRYEESEKHERLVIARSTSDGHEAFRFQIASTAPFVDPVKELTGLFIVQERDISDKPPNGFLLDRKGQIWHRLDREIVNGTWNGDRRIFLTTRDVVCISAKSELAWSTSFDYREIAASGEIIELPDKTLLAYIYCRISDDGV